MDSPWGNLNLGHSQAMPATIFTQTPGKSRLNLLNCLHLLEESFQRALQYSNTTIINSFLLASNLEMVIPALSAPNQGYSEFSPHHANFTPDLVTLLYFIFYAIPFILLLVLFAQNGGVGKISARP
jgi:hypothetical protein